MIVFQIVVGVAQAGDATQVRSEIQRALAEHCIAVAGGAVIGNAAICARGSGQRALIGLVIHAVHVEQAADVFKELHGYQLLLASSYFSAEQEENAVRAFLGWSPAALVVTSHFHSPGTEKMLAEADIPVIETWDYQPDREPIQIGFSHFEVGVNAARYLHGKGYRRIAFVQNSAPGDFSALERRDGYAATMREFGLEPWVFAPDADHAPFEAGKQGMEALMNASQRPDAIIYANDNLAAGGLLAGQRAGLKIPEDCAVLGFGDYPFAEMLLPSLSTIKPPALEIGVLAATRVLESLGVLPSDEVQRLNLLQCQVIEREST
ncbi:substrate-binding domain-containing protein [Pseudomonas kribbensis]|uniref:substrate-binding domain-containing protein n=1 Tax=Pseudomonas kribbensis TaxID=1628086 RepID=UPI003AF2D535